MAVYSRRSSGPSPRFSDYPDDGCEVAPSCLRCPLPQCKYDDPGLLTRMRVRARQAPALLLLAQGVSVAEVAEQTGYSWRAVHRMQMVAK